MNNTKVYPYRQRVVEERDELLIKCDALAHLILFDSAFSFLSKSEQNLLRKQSEAMRQYLDILEDRITAFGGAVVMDLGIDWSEVPAKYKYAAMDESGEVCLYEELPSAIPEGVWIADGDYKTIKCFDREPNWRQTLTKRPKGTEMKLDIDWTKIDSRFKYAAMDSNKMVYLYVDLPSPQNSMWDSGGNYGLLGSHAVRVGEPNWLETLTERPTEETEMSAQNNTHPHAAIIAEAIDTSRKINGRYTAHGGWEFRLADTAPTVTSPLTDDELLAVWTQTGPTTNLAELVERMRDLKRVAIAAKVATIRKVVDISFNMPLPERNDGRFDPEHMIRFAAATVAEFRVQVLKLIGE